MPTIKLEIPESVTLTMQGESVVLTHDEIAIETWQAMLNHGMRRKANDALSSAKSALKTAMGRDATDAELRKEREAIVTRFKTGDWGRAEAKPRDPVGDLATKLAQEDILVKLGAAAGLDTSSVPRAATIRDRNVKAVSEKLAMFGEFGGKAGNTFTWDSAAVARYVEKHGFRDQAKRQMDARRKTAKAVDLSELDI